MEEMDILGLDDPPAPAAPHGTTMPPAQTKAAPEEDSGGETSFDDESISQFKFDLFKGRKGQADRIAILNPLNLVWHRVHYDENKKGYVQCLSKYKKAGKTEIIEGEPAVCCKRMDEAKKRFGAFVAHYGTTPDAKVTKPLTYTLKLWRFGEAAFVNLRDVNAEFRLDSIDVVIRCTDEQFQKITISPCKERIVALTRFPEKDKADIAAWVKAMLPEGKKSLGKKLTEAQLLERLGMATGARTIAQENVVGDLADLLPGE